MAQKGVRPPKIRSPRFELDGRLYTYSGAAQALFWKRFKPELGRKLDLLESAAGSQGFDERWRKAFGKMFEMNGRMMRLHLVAKSGKQTIKARNHALAKMELLAEDLEEAAV